MYFQEIYEKSLSQVSYLIGCQTTGTAAVIDPKRDVDTYLQIAEENKLTITHIFETHIHADFLSGSRELAELTGAEMYLSDEGGREWQYQFAHTGLYDGDQVEVGNLVFNVIHTPGHTPESICLLLTDIETCDQPVMFFSGDFVFVGDVGRPDLLEKAAGMTGTREPAAHQMFQSMSKFNALPAFVQVWPAHRAGSACGKSLSASPVSTVGYEKFSNWAFRFLRDEKGFVATLLEGQPEVPPYFAMMKYLNKQPRKLRPFVSNPPRINLEQLGLAVTNGTIVIDTRSRLTYMEGHIPGSINIPNNNSFTTWAGWFIDYNVPFILIAPDYEIGEIQRKLMRIGLDHVAGYIDPHSIKNQQLLPLVKGRRIILREVLDLLSDPHTQVIDVRSKKDFDAGHIPGAVNLFLGTLPLNLQAIKQAGPAIVYCQGGDRSALAGSLLAHYGFKNILDFSGGWQAWVAGNHHVEINEQKESV
ncbi:MAG: MBL fold metallo-hydrolase [Chitinophagaceae bacterium]|nr:MAG: MBL fold metallo-hydrolase [Chitinophagaceae bacterium]